MRKILFFTFLLFSNLAFLKENTIISFSNSQFELKLNVNQSEEYFTIDFNNTTNQVYHFSSILSNELLTYSFYFRGGYKENEGLDLNTLRCNGTYYTFELFDNYYSHEDVRKVGLNIYKNNNIYFVFMENEKTVKGSLNNLRAIDFIHKTQL